MILVRATIILSTFLIACACDFDSDRESILKYNIRSDDSRLGTYLYVIIENYSEKEICFAQSMLEAMEGNISIYQNGKEISNIVPSNQPYVRFKGIDISDGVGVLKNGSTKLFIDISNYPIRSGNFQFTMNFYYVICKELFSQRAPKIDSFFIESEQRTDGLGTVKSIEALGTQN